MINATATIEFAFESPDDLDETEMLTEIEDRIRSGEYFPRNVVGLTIDAPSLTRQGA